MKKIFFAFIASSITLISNAQFSIEPYLIQEKDIAQSENLIESYFTPIAESFGSSLNNGWYNTAKPHSLGGFDITLTLNTVFIPNNAETFIIGDNFGGVFTSNANEASTIFGSKNTTEIIYNTTTNVAGIEVPISTPFDMPGGLKTPALPMPMLQAGVGLVKKTAIDIRYSPMLNVSNNINLNLFGVGLKHDLLQWIPGIGDAIPMSLSLQGGYTSLNTNLKIGGQEVSLKTQATTFNLIASKRLLMITGYIGLGYNSATTSFKSKAKFKLGQMIFDEEVNMNFESNRNLRTNVGLRFNMAIVTIQADYTLAKYPTATVGIGMSIR